MQLFPSLKRGVAAVAWVNIKNDSPIAGGNAQIR